MPEYPASTGEAERFCQSGGFDFVELQKVRSRLYRGTLRYRKLENSSTAFVKFHSDSKSHIFDDFVEIATDVGHPECHLINNQYSCLIMGKASGRPLSHLLPIVFVPGIWRFRKRRYEQAYFQLGEQLGVLHTDTADKCVSVMSDKKREKALKRTKYVTEEFSESLVTDLCSLLTAERQTDTVRHHVR